jgi:Ycf66 protein N-terminus
MIHMELAPSTLLGLSLTIAGILLYLIRTKNNQISRDYDLFFSSVGCLCGGILIFQGWRLDPILLLCQMMSGVTAIFFIAETIWLRNIDIEKQNVNFEMHQNLLKTNESIFLKHKKISKNTLSRQEISSLINKNKDLVKENIFFFNLNIDYTLPIDYY